jgi:membrane protease YdiL (CAAX protease family)
MNYWNQSRSPYYSFIFLLPLIIIYEFGIVAVQQIDLPAVRNGADILLRRLLDSFGVAGLYGIGFFIIVFMGIAYAFHRNTWNDSRINGKYLLIMLAESVALGLFIYVLIKNQPFLSVGRSDQVVQQLVLSLGAGIYEEFVFRLVLITGLSAVIGFIFQWTLPVRSIAAIIGAAVIFSIFHFVGEFGDTPSWNLFLIRFGAGLVLGTIYFLRGYGIAACSHSIYNLAVLTDVVIS